MYSIRYTYNYLEGILSNQFHIVHNTTSDFIGTNKTRLFVLPASFYNFFHVNLSELLFESGLCKIGFQLRRTLHEKDDLWRLKRTILYIEANTPPCECNHSLSKVRLFEGQL
jgi:hypothetical protein